MINYSHKFAMKKNEAFLPKEEASDYTLKKDKFYILRFDGVGMTKHFLGKPECKEGFIQVMKKTVELFMKDSGLLVCYSYSDEISVLLEQEILEKYEYRLEKILSIYTSKLTCAFMYASIELNFCLQNKIRAFDGRFIELEDYNDLKDYFISRQTFSISCHLLRLKCHHLKELKTTNTDFIIKQLALLGISYEQIPMVEKYGMLWIRSGFLPIYEFMPSHTRLYQQIINRRTFERKRSKKPFVKRRTTC